MSERIKELAEKSFADAYRICKECDHTVGETDSIFVSLAVSKFAELIVAECATYLNVAVEVHNQNEQDVCDRAARAIKRYFGVE